MELQCDVFLLMCSILLLLSHVYHGDKENQSLQSDLMSADVIIHWNAMN